MTISYQKGITTSPSDFLCESGELAECINLAVDNEEIKVLTPAKEVMALAGALLFVHAIDNEKNYIYKYDHSLYFKRGINGSGTSTDLDIYHDVKDIKAIGKTLIIECGTATYYAVWNGTNYDNYNKLPTPEVEFTLQPLSGTGGYYAISVRGDTNDIYDYDTGGIRTGKSDDYLNLVLGLYAEAKNKAAEKNAFINPFFACAALELYDGSYTRITNPVLLFPSVSKNHGILWGEEYCNLYVYPKRLHASLKNNNYERFKDIVKRIVFFVSDEIDLLDTASTDIGLDLNGYVKANSIRRYYLPNSGGDYIENQYCEEASNSLRTAIKYKEVAALEDEISSTAIFYKLCEAEISSFDKNNLSAAAQPHVLKNITTQQQLPLDYHSNSEVFSEKMYTYNNRLNLISPKRTFFEGFKHFVSYDPASSNQSYTVEVYISPDGGQYDYTAVIRTVSFNSKEILNIWFYYPDPRAYKAKIYNNDSLIYELPLKEHTGLNGAYYFGGMPTGGETIPSYGSGYPEGVQGASETLYNQIATSEVNNPWVFKAEGYNSVGSGSVMAVATQTQALSQGQFGQYPLIVFATDGIWAMDVNNTGLYQRVAPISRDVLTNENAIVETDNAVFFPSEKGLHIISGSTVREMSRLFCGRKVNVTQLPSNVSGESEEGRVKATSHTAGFRAFVNDGSTLAVYDYVNSRICFLNTRMDAAYAYHIDSGTLSQWLPDIPRSGILRVVRDYPHSLIAISTGSAYYPHNDAADAGNDHYAGYMLTRPVKFGEPLTVHSLREMKHVGYWNEAGGSSVRMELLMSDDMINWHLAGSRFGAAAKYWRWVLYVRMTPLERLSGTVVRTQQRRDNNLR